MFNYYRLDEWTWHRHQAKEIWTYAHWQSSCQKTTHQGCNSMYNIWHYVHVFPYRRIWRMYVNPYFFQHGLRASQTHPSSFNRQNNNSTKGRGETNTQKYFPIFFTGKHVLPFFECKEANTAVSMTCKQKVCKCFKILTPVPISTNFLIRFGTVRPLILQDMLFQEHVNFSFCFLKKKKRIKKQANSKIKANKYLNN